MPSRAAADMMDALGIKAVELGTARALGPRHSPPREISPSKLKPSSLPSRLARPGPGAASSSLTTESIQHNSATVPAASSTSDLSTRDGEMEVLRSSLRDKTRECGTLRTQVELLSKEGLDLERILTGYQKEAEKNSDRLAALENKQRKMGSYLIGILGEDWETEIMDRPTSSLILSSGSPLVRKFSGRASLSLRTGTILRRESFAGDTSFNPPLTTAIAEEGDESRESDPAPTTPLNRDHGSETKAFEQLNSIRDLIRGMERRMIERDLELGDMERTALESSALANAKGDELASLAASLVVV